MRKTIFTTVTQPLKRKLLLRGSFFGSIGISVLLIFSVWGTEALIEKWGMLIFATGIGLISLGMIPLRKIQRLERIPHQITFHSSGLLYEKRGKEPLLLPKTDILRLSYLTRGDIYGIEVLTRTLDRFFLPYFSEKSADALSDYIMHGDQADE